MDLQIVHLGPVMQPLQKHALLVPVTTDEVFGGLNSIGDTKDPGSDGFIGRFYKCSGNIMGRDIVAAIQEYFFSRKLLKIVNTTLITLIPKSSTGKTTIHLACCNVLYKIISNLLTN